jgi:hypothetical protein
MSGIDPKFQKPSKVASRSPKDFQHVRTDLDAPPRFENPSDTHHGNFARTARRKRKGSQVVSHGVTKARRRISASSPSVREKNSFLTQPRGDIGRRLAILVELGGAPPGA